MVVLWCGRGNYYLGMKWISGWWWRGSSSNVGEAVSGDCGGGMHATVS